MTVTAHIPPLAGPQLVGVGVGPGDPDLVTVRAIRVLDAADVVFVPVSDGHGPYGPQLSGQPAGGSDDDPDGSGPPPVGRAEATVRAHVHHDRIRRLAFQMTGDADYAGPARTVADALATHPPRTAGPAPAGSPRTATPAGSGLPGARQTGTGQTGTGAVEVAGGRAPVVAFATIGDPNVYSTFTALAAAVRLLVPDVTICTVPGIMALQDLAARSGTVLAHGTETLALLPLTAGVEAYRAAVEAFDTVVAYKGGRALPAVRGVLADAGRLDGPDGHAVYGAALGLPEEDIRDAGALPPTMSGPYLSTVLATRRSRWPQ